MLLTGFEFVGNHPKFLKSLELARNVAVTKTPVLISGEAGCGKKALGQYIHQNSARKNASCEVVDCSQDQALVEKRILGFRDDETGRFHRGALEVANGGTVIFAHVDAMDESFQKRLYTIFQELPDYELDVRIIATSTKNLSKQVGAGKFSRVLLTYLSGAQVGLIPLRERGTDVELLAQYFIQTLKTEQGEAIEFSPEALNKLCDYSWNQNVTELKGFIMNSARNTEDGKISLTSFEMSEQAASGLMIDGDEEAFKLMSLKDAEKLLIRKALVYTAENRTQAAKILGVSIRTLRNKINEYRTEGSQYFVNLR